MKTAGLFGIGFVMRCSVTSFLRDLRDDTGASSAIEYALLGPVLFALIIATIQTALVFIAQQGLESDAQNSARLILTGQSQQAGMTAAQFKTAACNALPPFLSCSNLYIDVTTASSWSAANTGAPTITYDSSGNVTNGFSFSPGTQGSIVVLRLMYMWPTIAGPLGFDLSNQPGHNRMLVATSVFKTETY